MSPSLEPVRPVQVPGHLPGDQDRRRMRFQADHHEVGFLRLTEPFPHWLAYWADRDGQRQGATDADFARLLDEVEDAFGCADR